MFKKNQILIFIILFLLFFSYLCYKLNLFSWQQCDGSPYLYLTFHHNLQGVR